MHRIVKCMWRNRVLCFFFLLVIAFILGCMVSLVFRRISNHNNDKRAYKSSYYGKEHGDYNNCMNLTLRYDKKNRLFTDYCIEIVTGILSDEEFEKYKNQYCPLSLRPDLFHYCLWGVRKPYSYAKDRLFKEINQWNY